MLKEIFWKKKTFSLEKLNAKTPIVTSGDNILNFGILCTQKRNLEK